MRMYKSLLKNILNCILEPDKNSAKILIKKIKLLF